MFLKIYEIQSSIVYLYMNILIVGSGGRESAFAYKI